MSQENDDAGALVERQSKHMMSFAIYRKLKGVVDSWNREERGKARVVAAALVGLGLWFALVVASAFFLSAYSVLISIAGFLVWIGFVAVLMRKHLGTPGSSA
jgi:hypothetical protein